MVAPHVRLSPTAFFTAQAWAHEGFENAELFATLPGRLAFGSVHWLLHRLGRRMPSLPWHEEFLLIRHYAIDTRVSEVMPSFLLEGGAGLSPRGLTYARANPEATVVEVDLPHMVRRKRRYLEGRGAPSNYHLVEGDLTDPHLLDGLPRVPGPADRTLVVTEGVLDYLSMDRKARVLSTLSRLLCDVESGCHLFDVYTRQRLSMYPVSTGAVIGLMSVVSGRRFSDQLFSDAASAEAFARDAGYTEVRRLSVADLNTSPYRPPMTHCHFELLEGRSHATSLPSTT
jgi:O-methyltransferase involved in polyketide biosynthesis